MTISSQPRLEHLRPGDNQLVRIHPCHTVVHEPGNFTHRAVQESACGSPLTWLQVSTRADSSDGPQRDNTVAALRHGSKRASMSASALMASLQARYMRRKVSR